MSDNRQETRAFLLMVVLAFWAAAFGYSVLFFTKGVDVSAGLNQMTGFLGWQGVAAMFAFAGYGLGRSFENDSGIRRVSAVPCALAVLMFVVVVAMYVLG